ncbi:MAG: tetratricopeptide repeat protein, partial [Proteobacteria bacterium]|nr:tetratricopeptide repeat protein [Pseudomonadota bacterium]
MSMVNRNDNGDLQTALKNAADLLAHDPRLAEEQVHEILKLHPDTLEAKRILASAYRLQKMPQQGLDVLAPLLAGHGDSPGFLHEIAQCLGGVGRGDDAVSALRRAITIDPKHAPSWQSLGHQLAVAGDQEGSRQAFERHFEISTRHPELVEAVKLLRGGKIGKAERIVRELLKKFPADVTAIRVLADIGIKLGQFKDASHLLERCLELAPDFHAARHSYAMVLMRRQKLEAANHEAEKL